MPICMKTLNLKNESVNRNFQKDFLLKLYNIKLAKSITCKQRYTKQLNSQVAEIKKKKNLNFYKNCKDKDFKTIFEANFTTIFEAHDENVTSLLPLFTAMVKHDMKEREKAVKSVRQAFKLIENKGECVRSLGGCIDSAKKISRMSRFINDKIYSVPVEQRKILWNRKHKIKKILHILKHQIKNCIFSYEDGILKVDFKENDKRTIVTRLVNRIVDARNEVRKRAGYPLLKKLHRNSKIVKNLCSAVLNAKDKIFNHLFDVYKSAYKYVDENLLRQIHFVLTELLSSLYYIYEDNIFKKELTTIIIIYIYIYILIIIYLKHDIEKRDNMKIYKSVEQIFLDKISSIFIDESCFIDKIAKVKKITHELIISYNHLILENSKIETIVIITDIMVLCRKIHKITENNILILLVKMPMLKYLINKLKSKTIVLKTISENTNVNLHVSEYHRHNYNINLYRSIN